CFGNKQYKPKDIQELFRKLFNDVQNIHEELAEYINTPSWNRPAFYNNDEDDDKEFSITMIEIHKRVLYELPHTDLTPPGIIKANCDHEEDIHLVERLLYDNSSPRPPEEFNSKNSNAIIESVSPSPIPVKDSDPFIEEIDLFLASDVSIPLGIDRDYSDSEWDNLFPERLLHDDPIPLLDILDFSYVV
nr:hypothetical protein [Tanacetum cinerariifolium]